jgi:S1-C subfamily serine protease
MAGLEIPGLNLLLFRKIDAKVSDNLWPCYKYCVFSNGFNFRILKIHLFPGRFLVKKLLLPLIIILSFAGPAPESEAANLSKIFQKVKPSVVVVQTVSTNVSNDPREKFVTSAGLGSGVIISDDGKVLTAAHVIQTADAVSVITEDNKIIPATIIASAPAADVALIQLEKMPDNAVVAKIGDSDKVAVGDEIFVVGAPYGLSYTLTAGHISSRHTSSKIMQNMTEVEMFQTDAAINAGNSGGPMFTMEGEVIGIVSHILSRSGGFEGLGFAVTTKVAQNLLIAKRSFWTGVEGVLLTGDLAKIFNVPQPAGFLLQRVADNSPASRLGLRGSTMTVKIGDREMLAGGDILLEAAGIPVKKSTVNRSEFQSMLTQLPPGKSVSIKLLRAGKVMELNYKKQKF